MSRGRVNEAASPTRSRVHVGGRHNWPEPLMRWTWPLWAAVRRTVRRLSNLKPVIVARAQILDVMLLAQWLRWCLAPGFWQAWRLDDTGERYDVRWSRPLFGLHFHLDGEYDMRGAAAKAWDMNTAGRGPRRAGATIPSFGGEQGSGSVEFVAMAVGAIALITILGAAAYHAMGCQAADQGCVSDKVSSFLWQRLP